MASAYTLAARESLIKLYAQGLSLLHISSETGISYGTVKILIHRYKTQGEQGLISHYKNCGRKRSYESERSYRLVRLYKHYHPAWGVEYILMKIKETYPDLPLCVSRVYERRLKTNHLLSMPKNPPLQNVYHPERARLPHDTWQIDAKENLRTLDGQAACYLTTIDEKTVGALEAKVFSLCSHQSSTLRRNSTISFADVPSMGIA